MLQAPEIERRFWSKVNRTPGGCWLWTASRDQRGGYGQFFPRHGVLVKAHRYAWAITHGPVPEGMEICHHCDNPPCVNPSHLFVGSRTDNQVDAVRKGRWQNQNAGKAFCIRGHHLTGANVAVTKVGKRVCKTCQRKRALARYHRRRAAGLPR